VPRSGERGSDSTYDQIYRHWRRDPAEFWSEQAEPIDWERRWDTVMDGEGTDVRWFRGGILNTCFNAVDPHVAGGRGERPALIHDSPVTGATRTLTYRELQDEVCRAAAGRGAE
jgi:propionyl-CoA synthetase